MRDEGCIWVTRTQPGADATAARLRALGRAPLVACLLEVRPLSPGTDLPHGVVALAFTSPNAVRAFSVLTRRRDWQVYAVGAATAQAARRAGFRHVSASEGDVDALSRSIVAAPPSGLVLHPCALEAAGDLSGALGAAGLRVESLPLYETQAVLRLPPSVSSALEQGAMAAALLHSPKAARALAALWADAGRPVLDRVRLLGLSAACLAPAADLPFATAAAPEQPNEAAMLELL